MHYCTAFLEFMRTAAQTAENRTNRILDNAHRCAYLDTMTTDERIDRLTERHEALTQSVELMAHEINALAQAARDLLELARIHEARIVRLEGEEEA